MNWLLLLLLSLSPQLQLDRYEQPQQDYYASAWTGALGVDWHKDPLLGDEGILSAWTIVCDGVDDYVAIPSNFAVSGAQDFLVQMWVKFTIGTGGYFAGGRVGDDGWAMGVTVDGKAYGEFRTVSYTTTITGTAAISAGWHYLEMFVSRADAKLYYTVDGVNAVAGAAVNAANTPAAHPSNIGALYRNVDGQYTVDASITSVRIWVGTIPTAAQRATWKLIPFLGPTASLVAEYPMLPGSGQVLVDYSGNGNNGRLGSTTGADQYDPAWGARYTRLTSGGPQ